MKKLLICLLCCSCLLTGCSFQLDMDNSNKTSEEPKKTKKPANAITAVVTDKEQGIDGSVIRLSDFEIKLPKGYVYGTKEYKQGKNDTTPNSTIYYVWQEDEKVDYVLDTDTRIMLYIYEGLDENSPHKEITDRQGMTSMKSTYLNHFASVVTLRDRYYDTSAVASSDNKYYVWQFKGNSGDSLVTAYSELCYPKAYYGIMGVESKTTDGSRKFYNFVFSNDGTGEFWKKSEYDSLMGQIKKNLNFSKFGGGIENAKYVDVLNGYSYEQLVTDELYKETNTDKKVGGLFYKVLLYYVSETGRSYERVNID